MDFNCSFFLVCKARLRTLGYFYYYYYHYYYHYYYLLQSNLKSGTWREFKLLALSWPETLYAIKEFMICSKFHANYFSWNSHTLSMNHLPEIFSTFSSFSPFSGRVSFWSWWTFFRPKFSGVLGFWTRSEFKQTETCSLKCTGRTNKSEFLNSCLINSKKNSSRLKFFDSSRDSTGLTRVTEND